MTRGAPLARRITGALLSLLLVVLAGGFAAAALVRYSPGFDIDENDWTPKLSAETRAMLHARNRVESSLPVFYARYLAGAAHGDFGISRTFQTPVADLLRERAGRSVRLILWGTGGGLLLGCLLAWLAVWPRNAVLAVAAASASGLLIAVPPAVLALLFFFYEAPLGLAVALAVAPRVFGAMRVVLSDIYASPALMTARAHGLPPVRLGLSYVLRPAMGHLFALSGVAFVIAFGCLIPVEALCDVPGIGQLAWKAALARDLPLLSALALIITFAVSSVHAVGEIAQ